MTPPQLASYSRRMTVPAIKKNCKTSFPRNEDSEAVYSLFVRSAKLETARPAQLIPYGWKRVCSEALNLGSNAINGEATHAEAFEERYHERMQDLGKVFLDFLHGYGCFQQCFITPRSASLKQKIA